MQIGVWLRGTVAKFDPAIGRGFLTIEGEDKLVLFLRRRQASDEERKDPQKWDTLYFKAEPGKRMGCPFATVWAFEARQNYTYKQRKFSSNPRPQGR